MTNRLTVEHFGGLPLISARSPNPKGLQFAVKYAADRVVALGLLLLALPVMIPAAIGVLLTTGRPLFFRQVRVGRDGRTFAMLKFRTMRPSRPRRPRSRSTFRRTRLRAASRAATAAPSSARSCARPRSTSCRS